MILTRLTLRPHTVPVAQGPHVHYPSSFSPCHRLARPHLAIQGHVIPTQIPVHGRVRHRLSVRPARRTLSATLGVVLAVRTQDIILVQTRRSFAGTCTRMRDLMLRGPVHSLLFNKDMNISA